MKTKHIKETLVLCGVLLSTLSFEAVAKSEGSKQGPAIFAIPTPNGGTIIGGQSGRFGGVVTHQPHGGGYTTNGLQFGSRGGTTFGGSMTTNPSGKPIGGTINFGTTF
jgi:hypothetical protein